MINCKNCHILTRSRTDLCARSNAISAVVVVIILCLVMSAIRTPPRSKKPCVFSYTPWEKLRLAFRPNS